MAAKDPVRRSRAASIASNVSWACTPDRSARTRAGYEKSPMSYAYWLNKITKEGRVRPQDRAKAAESAHHAYQQQMSAKAAAKRRAKAAENAASKPAA